MSKVKMIPAFINQLSYNERKYVLHQTLSLFLLGIYMTFGFTVLGKDILLNNFKINDSHFIIYCILIGLFLFEYIKCLKYKKLIKIEPSNKQQKNGDVSHG